jgi:hypothetical protein
MREALENPGVEFIPARGGKGVGVRLRAEDSNGATLVGLHGCHFFVLRSDIMDSDLHFKIAVVAIGAVSTVLGIWLVPGITAG